MVMFISRVVILRLLCCEECSGCLIRCQVSQVRIMLVSSRLVWFSVFRLLQVLWVSVSSGQCQRYSGQLIRLIYMKGWLESIQCVIGVDGFVLISSVVFKVGSRVCMFGNGMVDWMFSIVIMSRVMFIYVVQVCICVVVLVGIVMLEWFRWVVYYVCLWVFCVEFQCVSMLLIISFQVCDRGEQNVVVGLLF